MAYSFLSQLLANPKPTHLAAIENEIRGGVPGAVEVVADEVGTGGFILHFANHIANAAITEKVPGTADFSRKFKFLFLRTIIGYQHAVLATEAVAMYYLWPKFGP